MDNLLPKYYIIKKDLINKIDNNELAIDQVIPSERELMAMFDVSRITVRKAIDEMATEGYLYKVQGKGTYVKGNTSSTGLSVITSCTNEILRQGYTPSRTILLSEVTGCPHRIAADLEIEPGSTVYRLERIYYADGEPVNYTTVFVNYAFFPGIEKIDLGKESMYKAMENFYHVRLERSRRHVEAVAADETVAAHLQIPVNYPLLQFRGVTLANIGNRIVPVENYISFYSTQRIKFFIDQSNR